MPVQSKSFKVNAILNIVKQFSAIIFPLITFPYVSRALGVESYGRYNFSSSIISYVSLLAGLGISSYAIREGARIRDNKEKFLKFANEVFSINVVSTDANVCAFLPVFAPGAEYPVIPYIPHPLLFGCVAVPFISKLFLAFSVDGFITPPE